MILTVKLFARARDLAGAETLRMQLEEGATVAALRQALAEQQPTLAGLLGKSAIGVNGDFAAEDRPLTAGDEVAVLPPVSGGSC